MEKLVLSGVREIDRSDTYHFRGLVIPILRLPFYKTITFIKYEGVDERGRKFIFELEDAELERGCTVCLQDIDRLYNSFSKNHHVTIEGEKRRIEYKILPNNSPEPTTEPQSLSDASLM